MAAARKAKTELRGEGKSPYIPAMSTTAIRFAKMNGLGNAILVADLRAAPASLTADHARALAGQPRTAFDQLMVLRAPRAAGSDALVEIYNADGSRAGTCGNGLRCVAEWLYRATGKMQVLLELPGGLTTIERVGDRSYTVDMGVPRFGWQDIPLVEPFHDTRNIELQIGPIDKPLLHTPSAVNVGNPHCIFWVDDVDKYDLGKFGPMLEYHRLFPDRANISLAQVTSPTALRLRVWERGAGLTLACGSAACAAAVAAARKRLTGRQVTVTLPGGALHIDWRADDHIMMTGPCELEHEGVLDPVSLLPLAA